MIHLSWIAPADGGSGSVLNYIVTQVETERTWNFLSGTNGRVSAPPGAATFTVQAVNWTGIGPSSAPSNSVTSFGCYVDEDCPTDSQCFSDNRCWSWAQDRSLHVQAYPLDSAALITWTPAAGSSTILGYTIVYDCDGYDDYCSVDVITDPFASNTRITGLTNGRSYSFEVQPIGWFSSPAEPASAIPTAAATPPSPPRNVSATAGPDAVTVTWNEPLTDGQSPIVSYVVTAEPGGVIAATDGISTDATVTGLSPGTSYVFTVTAANAAGTSAGSIPSNAITPLP